MKFKLSPKEYGDILKLVELKAIYLKEVTSKFSDENVSKQLALSFKEKGTFTQEKSILKIPYSFKLTGKEEEKENTAFSISAEFTVICTISGENIITQEFFDIFKVYFVSMTVWPYFRELVSSLVTRANLPPLVLPLKRI